MQQTTNSHEKRLLTHLRPRDSTHRLWRAAREAGQSWWSALHGYVYARWTYRYIGSAIGERWTQRLWLPLFAPFLAIGLDPQRWANSYHGKVVSTEMATRLVQIKEPIRAPQPEKVIPFESARDLILAGSDPIVVLDCPCRLARENPCLPLDVCLAIGDPFASFILEHHPDRSRAITPAEAVEILEAESLRGHVHHAFFKEAMLNRFYAICNCCSCCCGAMSAHRRGTPMLISSGYVARLDRDLCEACGACAAICPFETIEMDDYPQVDTAACMGCGVCTKACPTGALTLHVDVSKPAPLEVPV